MAAGAEEIKKFMVEQRNWGRWGEDDELGAMNLITPAKVRQAATLIRRGQSFSLSRPLATKPARGNPRPAAHFVRTNNNWLGHEGVGAAAEFLGIDYHGLQTTHIDALCHTWDEDGGGTASTAWETPAGMVPRAAASKRGAQASRLGASCLTCLVTGEKNM
jgi:hypothetical protein